MASRIGVLLLLVLLAVAGYALYASIEVVEETTSEGFSTKALRNPFLAASQYLEHLGHRVESSRRMKQLDQLPEGGTVFISDSRQLRKQSRVDTLVNWMERGGHLIVGAQIIKGNNQNVLLKHFGVSKKRAECECEDEKSKVETEEELKKFSELLREANKDSARQNAQDQKSSVDDIIPDAELTKLYFEGVEHAVKIHFSEDATLYHPLLDDKRRKAYDGPRPFYWEENRAGIQFMQFHVGQGLLTVMSEGSIWNSRSIGTLDHAFLLSILTAGGEDILLVYGTQMPTIFELWRQYAPETLIAGLIWFIAWLLYRTKRFGGFREPSSTVRRSLDEHILASGSHLWRSKQRQALLSSIKPAIFRQLERINAGFSRLSPQQQVSLVSQQSGLSPQEVEMALFREEIASEEQFYHIVGLLQQLRNLS